MKNQIIVSHLIHAGREPLDRNHFTRFLIVVASLITALIMSACGAALPVTEDQPDVPRAGEQTSLIEAGTGVQRAFDADAARYSGLAVRYSTENVIGQSLPFDVEHLRQVYDANWVIEADAPDVRRPVQPIKGNGASEPPTFDIEHLRQIYDANWGIEADAPDVHRPVQPIRGNGASEPPTFDIEHLRQIYDANWGIEADAVDVNPADQSSIILATNPELALV